MPTTTLGDICDQARAALADDRKQGGQKYTNDRLFPHAQQAVRELFRVLRNITDPFVRKEVFHVLPANTSMLAPATAGITDMFTPVSVDQRGGLTTKSVSAVSIQSNYLGVDTSTDHDFATGDQITLNAMGGLSGTEGLWGITVDDADTFRANGCIATGAYTSGGVAVKSTEEFLPLDALSRIHDSGNTNASISTWTWMGGNLWFSPSANERQLRIRYDSSATAPTKASDAVTVDDSKDFLAYRAAALASKTRAPTISRELNLEALGRSLEPDASGGMLRSLLLAAVRAEQRRPPEDRQRGSFREPREILLW